MLPYLPVIPYRLNRRSAVRIGILAYWLSMSGLALASPPTDAAAKAKLLGTPSSLQVHPAQINLSGRLATQQVLVQGQYADGSVRDLTAIAEFQLEQPLAQVDLGFLRPQSNGETKLTVKVGTLSATVPVRVEKQEVAEPVSFRRQVIAALSIGGCNQGACHGTPSGKNGFKLSLRGFDPASDYLQLTRDVWGRRTDRLAPNASLLVQKGLGRVPHEGGQRFVPGSLALEMVQTWLAEGMADDPSKLPPLKKIDILPGSRVLRAPARWQQLAVVAHFADGSSRDVTRMTVYSSSDPAVADVNANGLVEFKQTGEVAILCRYLDELQTVRLTYLEPKEGFVWPNPPEVNLVDRHVFAKLRQLNIAPSELCADHEFVRRAFLDVCGRLPTAVEVRRFLEDRDPNKRAKLIDALLERTEYADFWTLKWSDVFRPSRKTIQLKGTHAFQQWLRAHLASNTPIDALVRELLTANGDATAVPPANFFRIARDPQNLAETTAQLFLGVRMQCAKCHNHPFERWTQDDYYSTAAWFARVRQRRDPKRSGNNPQEAIEIIYSSRDGEVTQPRTGRVMAPKFPGGEVAKIAPGQDRRAVFAEWLTKPDNPFFAKSVVNRVWFHLMGKGIVDPVDDFRESNPSANDELLTALAQDFAAHRFDLKHLIRTITRSRTYQLSATPNDTNRDDTKYFSRAFTKLLTAEQLLDALCDVTAVPEKFAGLPLGTRAIQLPDGEVNHPFLKTFGQPARELACECERESDSNLAQALQLINGPTINEKIRQPNNRLGKLLGEKKSDSEIMTELYLTTLSRYPTDPERQAALAHVAKHPDKRRAWEDILWALLNTREFLFRH